MGTDWEVKWEVESVGECWGFVWANQRPYIREMMHSALNL